MPIEMAQKGEIEEFKGQIVQRKTQRDPETPQQQSDMKSVQSNEQGQTELNELTSQETEREKQIKICKRNSNRILHERFKLSFKKFFIRNIYVFLASVAEDAMNNYSDILISQFVGFFLVKQLLVLIENLKSHLVWKNNVFELSYWEEYIKTKDFLDIFQYISREFEIFNVYFTQLADKLNENIKLNMFKNQPFISGEHYAAINTNVKQNITEIYQTTLTEYSKQLISKLINSTRWVHIYRLIDCLKLDQVFIFEDKLGTQFNFKQYYEEPTKYELAEIVQKVHEKLEKLKIKF